MVTSLIKATRRNSEPQLHGLGIDSRPARAPITNDNLIGLASAGAIAELQPRGVMRRHHHHMLGDTDTVRVGDFGHRDVVLIGRV